MEIHQTVFGEPATDNNKRENDMRDALHIDQAHQHNADFFITDDRAILDAGPALAARGIGTPICTVEDCLAEISAYFGHHYGTTDRLFLARRLGQDGPIILGSSSFGSVAFTDTESGEELLAFQLGAGGAEMRAIVRAPNGARLMSVVPGRPIVFDEPGSSIAMEVGPAPLAVGDKTCRSFAVEAGEELLLAGRILRSGRLLMHDVTLHNKSGRLVLRVTRDVLEVGGVAIGTS
jgi:hypothetical protein